MTDANKPTRLDAGIDDSTFGQKIEPLKQKKDSKLLPYLLGVLVLLAGFYFISGRGKSGVGLEMTTAQEEVQVAVTDIVENYMSENDSLPDDPSQLNLPAGSEIVVGDDGSWMVSTADGQLIMSEDALPPFEDISQ